MIYITLYEQRLCFKPELELVVIHSLIEDHLNSSSSLCDAKPLAAANC